MKIVNLQPHAVVLPNGKKIEPSGNIARVSESLKPVSHPLTEVLGIPIAEQKLSDVTVGGLPFPAESKDVFYIVSLYVAQALPHRGDMLVPIGQFRDEQGKIVGCEALAIANSKLSDQ